MPHSRILVLGGSGFIGTHVVSRLSAQGLRVLVPTRHRERARHLILLPTVDVVEVDLYRPGALAALVEGCDAVVNLVGVLQGRAGGKADPWGPDFGRAHIDLPAALVEACRQRKVRRLVHVSALGVTDGGKNTLPSRYLRSKAAGEEKIRQARDLDWTILRPSVVFGAEDAFLNLFAKIQRFLPVLALAKAEARFQPVWVGDVAQAVVNVLDSVATHGRTYARGVHAAPAGAARRHLERPPAPDPVAARGPRTAHRAADGARPRQAAHDPRQPRLHDRRQRQRTPGRPRSGHRAGLAAGDGAVAARGRPGGALRRLARARAPLTPHAPLPAATPPPTQA
jgi:uncharacterized protein YbjT (DUF2867 family)